MQQEIIFENYKQELISFEKYKTRFRANMYTVTLTREEIGKTKEAY